MTPTRHFARNYAEARAKFIAVARACDLAVASEVLPDLRGVDDEALAMDVALLGPPDADGACATWSNRTLRSVLRRHASGRRRVAWLREQMRDAFYVEADDWKEQVFAQARTAALLTVERMSESLA